jgi:hypothetical protein
MIMLAIVPGMLEFSLDGAEMVVVEHRLIGLTAICFRSAKGMAEYVTWSFELGEIIGTPCLLMSFYWLLNRAME